MSDENKKNPLLQMHTDSIEKGTPFWVPTYKSTVTHAIERSYSTEVIRTYYVNHVVPREGGFLVEWAPRLKPLTDEELKEKYGRDV